MKPRTMLIVSILLGVVAAGMLWYQVRGNSVTVFQVIAPVRMGDTLEAAVEPVALAASTYSSMASVIPTVELQDFVVTTPVVREVEPGEFVTFDMLLQSAGERVSIAPGMRAVGVDVGRPGQAAGYLVRPGDLVDVIATVPSLVDVTVTGDPPPVVLEARHVLQARRVLAVDQQYRLEDSAFLRNRTFSSVTLEVTPEEAQLIEVYRSFVSDGFLLSLRPPTETDPVNTSPTPVPLTDASIR